MPTFLPAGIKDELDTLKFDNRASEDIAALEWERRSLDEITRLSESSMPTQAFDTPSSPVYEAPQAASLVVPRRPVDPTAGQIRTAWRNPGDDTPDIQPDAATRPSAPRTTDATFVDGRNDPQQRMRPGESVGSVTMTSGPRGDPSGGVEQWDDLVQEASRTYGVPPAIIKGIMHIESGGNPGAVSAAGALGLMQTMPFHYQAGENGMDPRTNVLRGTKILADNYARYGDWDRAAAAYFGAIDGNGNITDATDATGTNGSNYVRMFRDAAGRYQGAPNAGAASPSAPAAPPSAPAAAPPPVAAGAQTGGGDEVTIRSSTGGTLRVPRSMVGDGPGQYSSRPERGGYQIVDGPADAYKLGASDVPESEMSAGDQKRQRLAAAQGDMYRQPLNQPTMGPDTLGGADETLPTDPTITDPTYVGTPPPAQTTTYNDPTADGTLTTPLPSQAPQYQYQNGGELTPTGAAQAVEVPTQRTQYDVQIADGRTVPPTPNGDWQPLPAQPSSYNDPTAGGTIDQPLPPQQPMAQGNDNQDGPTFAQQSMSLPDLTPVYDGAGRLISYIRHGAERIGQQIGANMEQNRRNVEQANAATGYGQVSSTPGEPDYVPKPETPFQMANRLREQYLPMAGGAPEMGARLREINDIAARDQGKLGDVRAMFTAADDPAWRTANPALAAEYDDLQSQYAMTVAGQVGDAPNMLGRAGKELRAAAESGATAAPNVGTRIRGAFADNAERVADDGVQYLGSGVVPESRIPRAGYATDISPGAERMVRDATEANAPRETVRRAEVAQKAEDILGLDPDTVQRWQREAVGEAPDARAVRGEALRQAAYVDAENADRAIERLRAAQERARQTPVGDMGADDKLDVADALLEAAETARAFAVSERASTAEGRAAARALGQRRNAITARQAFTTAERARQVAQDAAFAAREVQQAAQRGQVTPQGVQRLRTLRDKLLEAERHGLVGDGAGGRLDAMEAQRGSTTAAVAVGPVQAPERPRTQAARVGPTAAARPQVGLGTQLATDIGNSVLGAGSGGAAGYMAPAASEEERRKNAQAGAVVGAIGFPIVGRTLRGRGTGTRALLGPVPTPDNPQRAIAIGADPATRYEMRYRVVDLGDLTPSNLPNGAPNPAFPRELQPRSRERAASQLQIGRIAQSLDPVALLHDAGRLDSGPPIVGPDRLVESGNGRTLALARAAEQHPERYQAYVDTLRANLGEFGLSERDIEGMRRPVLVRERVTAVDRPSFVAEANGSTVQRMSPAESAAQSAANLSDDVVTSLNIGENDSIAAALRRADNRDLVRQWIGSIPENERAELLDASGNISPQGYDQLAAALLTRTYGDGAATRAFIEAGDPEVRNVQTAVMGSLPDVARAEALIRAGQRDPGLSVAEDVARATEVLARLKAAKMSVADYVRQVAMGDRELTPFQETVLQFLDQNQRRPSSIRQALREYASVVENAADPNQADMFGGAVASVTKEDAWASATAGVQRERQARVAAQRARTEAENAARTPAADIVPSTGGPEGTLTQEGAPVSLARPTQAERGTLPTGGPEGRLQREGAPPEPANLAPVGDMSTGGPEGTLTLSSGRSVKDVAAQIDEVLANPNAPGAADRLRELHADLQEISTEGFRRSSDIRRRLQRNGLLRAGLASKEDNVDALVRALAKVDPDQPGEMRAILEVISRPRLIDKILEYQYVNMLSSPITQAVNISSNVAQIAGRLLLQNPLEFVYSGGKSTGVGAAFQGAGRGFREGLTEAGQIMRTGTSSNAIDAAIEMGTYGRINTESLPSWMHVISTRPLAAMDALLGHVAYASAAEQYAQRTADRLLKDGSQAVKGMSREQARAHVMANIWDYPDIVERAGKIEDYTLLKGRGNTRMERGLRDLVSSNVSEDAGFGDKFRAFLANQIVPFTSVPINFAKQGAERTLGVPVNAVRSARAFARGDVEQGAELAAKATIGGAAITAAGMLAWGDNLTGDGPSDAGQRKVWLQQHRPNSFRAPGTDTWVSWEGTPFAIPFGMVAGVKEGASEALERSHKKGQSDAVDVIGSAAIKSGQGALSAFASQSFVRGLADQFKLLTGQDVSLSSIASSEASRIARFIPSSGMVGFLAKVTDTMERDTGRPQAASDMPEAIGARIANRIPGIPGVVDGPRQRLDPNLDIYGQPVPNEQYGATGLLPYYRGAGPRANDPITDRLAAAGKGVSGPPSDVSVPNVTGSSITLTVPERHRYEQYAGEERRKRLDAVMSGGRYDALPPAGRQKLLDDLERDARDAAAARIRKDIGPEGLRRRDLAARQPAGVR